MVTHILPGGLRYLTRSQPPGEVHLDTDSVQMREVSPLGGLLPQSERAKVLAVVGR